MGRYILYSCILTGLAIGQQNIPTPAVVLPNISTSAEGRIYVPLPVNGCSASLILSHLSTCRPAIYKNTGIDLSNQNTAFTVTSGSTLNINGFSLFGAAATITNTGGARALSLGGNLHMTSNTSQIDNVGKLSFTDVANTYTFTLYPSTAMTASITMYAPSNPGTSGQFLENTGSNLTLWSDVFGLWSSYTPTVTSSSGTPTTTTLSAHRYQSGKMVFFRINWTGTVSVNSSLVSFSLPVSARSATEYQVVPDGVSWGGIGYSSFGSITPGSSGVDTALNAGVVFPSATTLTIWLNGFYETN